MRLNNRLFRSFHFKQITKQLRFRLIKWQNFLLCSSFYDSNNTQEIIHVLGHWWVHPLKPLKYFIHNLKVNIWMIKTKTMLRLRKSENSKNIFHPLSSTLDFACHLLDYSFEPTWNESLEQCYFSPFLLMYSLASGLLSRRICDESWKCVASGIVETRL